MELKGIYIPITTPFKEENFYPQGLAQNFARWNQFLLTGYILLGSTGEAVMLSDREKIEVVEEALKHIPQGKQVIVGNMYHSLHNSVEFINTCANLGVQAALVLPPHYYRNTTTAADLNSYYLNLADRTKIPLLIYHFPAPSGITLSVDAVLTLSSHPNIIGIKDSSASLIFQQSLIAESLSDFAVLTGSASTLYVSCLAGAAGGIVALGNVVPQLCLNIFQATRSGNLERARQTQFLVNRLNVLTTRVYGIGGLKYAMDLAGYYGGKPRSPLPVPDAKGKKEIEQELKKLNGIGV